MKWGRETLFGFFMKKAYPVYHVAMHNMFVLLTVAIHTGVRTYTPICTTVHTVVQFVLCAIHFIY